MKPGLNPLHLFSGAGIKFGAVCFAFIIVGYQTSLFVHHASVLRIAASRSAPDTIYIAKSDTIIKRAEHPQSSYERAADAAVRKMGRAKTKSFSFNPNTVSIDDLIRLGFSEKQALSIDAYRKKGGRFHRPSDFGKSYVVADSVFQRLRPFINIPKLDINKADSAEFDALPGIGPYFASKMVQHREELGGYSCISQLTDIWHFDAEKLQSIEDLIYVTPREKFDIWQVSENELAGHPYIRNRRTAHSIIIFRENSPSDSLSLHALFRAGVIDSTQLHRLQQL